MKAIEALKKDLEQAVGARPDTNLLLAEIYLRNNRLDEAEEECNQAFVGYQDRAYPAHNVYGKIMERKGDLGVAESHFYYALGEPPWTFTEAWMNLCENLMKQKRWGDAIGRLKEMIVAANKGDLKDVDFQKIYLDLGLSLLSKGDHQGAIDSWHKCLDYNQSNAEAHLQLGMLLDAEQHVSSAIKEYREFVRTSPDQYKVARAKERLLLLEQRLAPAEAEPRQSKLSPYMRKQVEQEQEQLEKEELRKPKESGF